MLSDIHLFSKPVIITLQIRSTDLKKNCWGKKTKHNVYIFRQGANQYVKVFNMCSSFFISIAIISHDSLHPVTNTKEAKHFVPVQT